MSSMQLKTKLFTGFLLVSIKKGFTAVTIILFGRIIEIASVPPGKRTDHLMPIETAGLCPDFIKRNYNSKN